MKEHLRYETKDGKIFEDKDLAIAHEQSLDKIFKDQKEFLSEIKTWDIYKDGFNKLEKAKSVEEIGEIVLQDVFTKNVDFTVADTKIANIQNLIYTYYTLNIITKELTAILGFKVSYEFAKSIMEIITDSYWDIDKGSQKTYQTVIHTAKEIARYKESKKRSI